MLSVPSCGLLLLSLLNAGPAQVDAEIHTSIALIKRMVRHEKNILLETRNKLPKNIRDNDYFVQFYQKKLKQLAERNITLEMDRLQHPNAVFATLQTFAMYYGGEMEPGADKRKTSSQWLNLVANKEDMEGAADALLRLQQTYGLDARDMAEGRYCNTTGPPLSYSDAYQIGEHAFLKAKFQYSVDWLEISADIRSAQSESKEVDNLVNLTLPRISALLGRALLRVGHKTRAESIYRTLLKEGRDEAELPTLAAELKDEPAQDGDYTSGQKLKEMYRLCATHGSQPQNSQNPRLRCRYRGRVPYFRYQEEVLHEKPYISVFYDVITRKEMKKVQGLAITKMSRAVVVTPTGANPSFTRTSQGAYLNDSVDRTVLTLSQRVGYVTGLDTRVSPQGFLSPSQSSSEPFQVVNYGLGGHFSMHRDPLQYFNFATRNLLTYSGKRIATFLIYMGDVTIGGYTVFPYLNVTVRPIKGSAVFWYNYSPSGELEEMTWHAGCPVVLGDKWISNKWILSFGNTFVRRCGRSRRATQLDIEEDMIARYS